METLTKDQAERINRIIEQSIPYYIKNNFHIRKLEQELFETKINIISMRDNNGDFNFDLQLDTNQNKVVLEIAYSNWELNQIRINILNRVFEFVQKINEKIEKSE